VFLSKQDSRWKQHRKSDEHRLRRLQVFQPTQILAILENCVELENISLYYFPKKVIKMPVETGAAAPTTGFTKVPKPKWADASEFLILKDDNWYSVPNSFKKLVSMNIFDSKLLKKYKKFNKLNIKKKESLIKMVTYFNSI